jgi:hypothetical protein
MIKEPVAILQIIPNHHDLLPARLVKALAMLDELGHPYTLHDIERSSERDFRLALMKLFAGIKEDTVLVSMACHNNYPKIETLIFLYLYLPLLKNKKVIICSAYFSLYETALIGRDNVEYSALDIDEYVQKHVGDPQMSEDAFLGRIEAHLKRYGYENSRMWGYLTFGCYAKCSFCYNRLPFAGAPDITQRSPESVLAWMRASHRCGKTYFEFSEPNFLSDKPFALAFMKRLKDENPGVTWRCKTRLDDITPDIYEQMLAAGCKTIFFGVEQTDPFLLARIRKGEDCGKRLAEFLAYRREETTLHLSFLTGIRGETAQALRHNLDKVLEMGALKNVDPNIGWQILFDRRNRVKTAVPNYIVAFMFALNFLPSKVEVSPPLMRDILKFAIKEPFFDFWYMTEAEDSLALMQQLVVFLKTNPQQRVIKDYDRLLSYQGGALTKLILKSRSLDELNNGVLSLMGVEDPVKTV